MRMSTLRGRDRVGLVLCDVLSAGHRAYPEQLLITVCQMNEDTGECGLQNVFASKSLNVMPRIVHQDQAVWRTPKLIHVLVLSQGSE